MHSSGTSGTPGRRVSLAQLHRLEYDEARPRTVGTTVVKVVSLESDKHASVTCADVDAAWAQVIERHTVLRSVFPAGTHHAVTLDADVFGVRCVEADGDVEGAIDAEIQQWRADHTRTDRDPLARLVHIHNADEPKALLLVDHLVFDGLSGEIVSHELQTLVRGDSLPALSFDYYDYAQRQRDILAEEPSLTEYWVRRLAGTGIRPVLELPRAYPEIPGEHRPEIRRNLFPFGERSAQNLVDVSRQYSTTPYAVAATCLLIAARRHQEGASVGFVVPSAGRSIPGTENLVGFFANMLAVAVELPDDPVEALATTTRAIFEAIDYDIVPKAHIIRTAYLEYRRDDPQEPYIFFDLARNRGTDNSKPALARRIPSSGTRTEPGLSIYLHVLSDEAWLEVHSTDAYTDQVMTAFEAEVARAFHVLHATL